MSWFDFQSYSIWLNFGIFAVAAGLVWFVGSRIARYADGISERTGLGQAFVGALFLAVATSSPEIATTVTAAWTGNAPLAVNNLLGGITMQTTILAVVDLIIVRGALTIFTPRPVLLLQGVLLVLLLGVTLAGINAGELFSLFGVGFWSVLLFGLYVLSLYLMHGYEQQERWQPTDIEQEDGGEGREEAEQMRTEEQENKENAEREKGKEKGYEKWSLTRLLLFFGGGTLIILVAGAILARVGDALAQQTGLGASFVGVTLLAIATSLPEVSTTLTTARLGNYSMAVSNIFGSNAFMVALFLIADLAYREGPILTAVEPAAAFAAAAGVTVTAVYLAGMIERKDRTIWRMGFDSAGVLVLYLGSLVVLYQLK
ncbi:MAG: sodium:calcium antiporter [Anaerolineae bacterium]|nr:sodium:calcium antiporter [Anaerolineae bacterium]